MKFKRGRDNSPFQYKGYEAWIRRWEPGEFDHDAIEVRLVKRDRNPSKTMIVCFIIDDKANLYRCLHRAVRALRKAELEQLCQNMDQNSSTGRTHLNE